ncbi:MAG: hypothetical protein ACLP5H_22745 [Desulfomonilaceae bacterium]
MQKRLGFWMTIVVVSFTATFSAGAAPTEELIVKNCTELIRIAQVYQEDLKTVDTVLGSAIDAGNMDRIKNYKLKKAAVKKQLESVMKAIDIKGCVTGR